MMRRRIYLLITGVFVLLWAAGWWGQQALLHPESSEFRLASFLYPSLEAKLGVLGVENVSGFVAQLKWRWLALCLLAVYMFRYTALPGNEAKGIGDLSLAIKLLLLAQFLYLPDLYKELLLRHQWQHFYSPFLYWRWIFPSFPALWLIQGLFGAIALSAILLFLNANRPEARWTLIPAGIIPVSWMLLLSVFFGFHKIDHTYATLYLGLGMLPLLVYVLHKPELQVFSFRLLQACIWGCYFFAGMEKLFLSGLDWFNQEHFRQLAFLHPTHINLWLLQFPLLGAGVLLGGWVFQLSCVLQWRYPAWGYATVVGGILFHIGNWLLFDIGGWQSPWVVMLIFLWPGWLATQRAPLTSP